MAENRNAKGQFAAGHQPANVRRVGVRRKLSNSVFDKIVKATPAILDKLIESAKGGDVAASKLLLAQVMPQSKTGKLEILLPKITCAEDLITASAAVIDAVASGVLPLDHGGDLLKMLEAHRILFETGKLEAQVIEIVEGTHDGN